jgi:hypothetical protein
MAQRHGEVAVRDPDELVKEIEATRENLARTIDALTERVSPAHIARSAVDRGRQKLSQPQAKLAAGLTVAAVVTAAWLAWRRRR